MKIRVLFVLENLAAHGAHRTTLNLVRSLNREQFEPALVVVEEKGDLFAELPQDISVHYLSKKRKYNKFAIPLYVARIARIARRYDIVVGCIELRMTYLAYVGARMAGKKVIGWVRIALDKHIAIQMHSKHHTIVKWLYPRLDKIVCVSKGAETSIRNCLGDKLKKPPSVAYNVYDIDAIVERGKARLPEELDPIFERPTIIGVGRLMKQKRFDVLIHAFSILRKKGLDANLCIVGTGFLEGELKALVTELRLTDFVFFPGYIANPYPIIKRSHVFVLSSDYEGLSGVAMEAMALGVPVVATSCDGTTELISDGHNGLLAPVGDPEAIASGIESLFLDKNLRARISRHGERRAHEFSPVHNTPPWEELLVDLHGSRLL